ncbi:hypothetical protein OH491_27575 (plasmid) [Termitidicoccus mucosus]|uniref:hypothetical protein n=1 Tax=Termitidicoccus mucosus TaxID=1184151 RepID=UPI003183E2A6
MSSISPGLERQTGRVGAGLLDAVLNVTSASVVRSLIANAQTGVEFVGIVRMQAEKEKIAWLESRRSKRPRLNNRESAVAPTPWKCRRR